MADKVYVVFFDEDSRDLIFPIKRTGRAYAGMPQFFGGTKEVGESDRNCLAREVQEESDAKLTLESGGLKRVYAGQVGRNNYRFYVSTSFSGHDYVGPLNNAEMARITTYYVEDQPSQAPDTNDLLERLGIVPTIDFAESQTWVGFDEALKCCAMNSLVESLE